MSNFLISVLFALFPISLSSPAMAAERSAAASDAACAIASSPKQLASCRALATSYLYSVKPDEVVKGCNLLGELRSAQDLRAIETLLRTKETPLTVQVACARTVGRLGAASGGEVLRGIAIDPTRDVQVRVAAIRAATKLEGVEHSYFVALLKDQDPKIRGEAAYAVGLLQIQDGAAEIKVMLTSNDSTTRQPALTAASLWPEAFENDLVKVATAAVSVAPSERIEALTALSSSAATDISPQTRTRVATLAQNHRDPAVVAAASQFVGKAETPVSPSPVASEQAKVEVSPPVKSTTVQRFGSYDLVLAAAISAVVALLVAALPFVRERLGVSKVMGTGSKSFESAAFGGSTQSRSEWRRAQDIQSLHVACTLLLAPGFLGLLLVAAWYDAMGSMLLWGSACLLAGGAVGFLFGIPRSGDKESANKGDSHSGVSLLASLPSAQRAARPNTNLEEVSDWLTKIIVGLGLVHLSSVYENLQKLSLTAAASLSLTPNDTHRSIAMATIVCFSVAGFIFGYLYTRLFLQGAIGRADQDFFERTVASVLSSPSAPVPSAAGEPTLPSLDERVAARRVLEAAPSARSDEVLAPLKRLATEYDRLRDDLPYGRERTRRMSEIAQNMRKVCLPAKPWLSELSCSSSAGLRLAAIMILQLEFDPSYIDWLSSRIHEESNYPAYQAVSALSAWVRGPGNADAERIRAQIQLSYQEALKKKVAIDESLSKLIGSV